MANAPSLRYLVTQCEQGALGERFHLQGYCEFSVSLRRSEVKRRLQEPSVHLEPRSGSRGDARRYCMVRTWKGESKGRVAGPWESGEWVNDVRGSVPETDSPSKRALGLVLQGLNPSEVAAADPHAFFTHSRKVIDTFLALKEAQEQGLWEPVPAPAASEEE